MFFNKQKKVKNKIKKLNEKAISAQEKVEKAERVIAELTAELEKYPTFESNFKQNQEDKEAREKITKEIDINKYFIYVYSNVKEMCEKDIARLSK